MEKNKREETTHQTCMRTTTAHHVGNPTEHPSEEKGEEMYSKAAARPNAGWLLHKINKQTQPQQRFLLHSPRRKVEE